MGKFFIKLYFRLIFGNMTSEVKATDGGYVSEIAFYGRKGQIIGYWAYGSYDKSLPYKGQF